MWHIYRNDHTASQHVNYYYWYIMSTKILDISHSRYSCIFRMYILGYIIKVGKNWLVFEFWKSPWNSFRAVIWLCMLIYFINTQTHKQTMFKSCCCTARPSPRGGTNSIWMTWDESSKIFFIISPLELKNYKISSYNYKTGITPALFSPRYTVILVSTGMCIMFLPHHIQKGITS